MRFVLFVLLLGLLGLTASVQAQRDRPRADPYAVPKMFVEAIRRKDCKLAVDVVNDLLQARDPTAGLLTLGYMRERAICVAEDRAKAKELYLKAFVRRSNPDAAVRLAALAATDASLDATGELFWWIRQSGRWAVNGGNQLSSNCRPPETDDPDAFVKQLSQWDSEVLQHCRFANGLSALVVVAMGYPEDAIRADASGEIVIRIPPGEGEPQVVRVTGKNTELLTAWTLMILRDALNRVQPSRPPRAIVEVPFVFAFNEP
jgi:hypothetical protein